MILLDMLIDRGVHIAISCDEFYKGSKLWNSLSEDVQRANNIVVFLNHIYRTYQHTLGNAMKYVNRRCLKCRTFGCDIL